MDKKMEQEGFMKVFGNHPNDVMSDELKVYYQHYRNLTATQQANELATLLEKSVNSYADREFSLRLYQCIMQYHRTLQQSTARLFGGFFQHFAKGCELLGMDRLVDGRNTGLYKASFAISKLELYFPLV
jgi:hypothetical protein